MLLDETVLSEGHDIISWRLDPSGSYSVSSMYRQLSQGANVAHCKDIWVARVLLKIRIFSWQLVLDRLPSNLQLATRHGPSNGNCALCGQPEDASYILFTCSMAKFSWSVLRQLLGCSWCPGNFTQFYAILSGFNGQPKRLLWILLLAQSWALWLVRNKLTIESKTLSHPADIIYKTIIFLQLWKLNTKAQDKEGLDWMTSELRAVNLSCAPSRTTT